jgi:hypothetical protein
VVGAGDPRLHHWAAAARRRHRHLLAAAPFIAIGAVIAGVAPR